MLGRVLRGVPLCVLLLTVTVLGVRYAAQTLLTVPPLDLFEPCEGLCWQQIQPGVTTIADSIDLLQAAGITNLRPFAGEFIYNGVAIKTQPDVEGDAVYDAYVTADVNNIVNHITLAEEVCAHVALASLGKPGLILQPPYRADTFVYVFSVGRGNVVIFRNRPGESVLVGAGLLSAGGYQHLERLSLYAYEPVSWSHAENVLRQPCPGH